MAILLVGASFLIDWTTKEITLSALVADLFAVIIFWLPGQDTKAWLSKTYFFAKKIVTRFCGFAYFFFTAAGLICGGFLDFVK